MEDFYKARKILVTGGHGFLGKHFVKRLSTMCDHISAPTKNQLDLRDRVGVDMWIYEEMPDIIFHFAANVGGIHYNMANPATLIHDNTLMALNIMKEASQWSIKVVAAGSVCAYPEYAPIPIIEKNLYNGYPEESNGAYGNAKRMLLELQRAYYKENGLSGAHMVSANLYGPGDNFDQATSHVIPALIMKIQHAIEHNESAIVVWGTGKPSRDFLYVEDAVEAYLQAGMKIEEPEPVNIASGCESPIHFLASQLCEIMGFDGDITYDDSKPDGQPRRAFQTRVMLELTGWTANTPLDVGLQNTVSWYRENVKN